jgi:hypothetical protein
MCGGHRATGFVPQAPALEPDIRDGVVAGFVVERNPPSPGRARSDRLQGVSGSANPLGRQMRRLPANQGAQKGDPGVVAALLSALSR